MNKQSRFQLTLSYGDLMSWLSISVISLNSTRFVGGKKSMFLVVGSHFITLDFFLHVGDREKSWSCHANYNSAPRNPSYQEVLEVVNGEEHQDEVLDIGNCGFLKRRDPHGNPVGRELGCDGEKDGRGKDKVEQRRMITEGEVDENVFYLIFNVDSASEIGKTNDCVIKLEFWFLL